MLEDFSITAGACQRFYGELRPVAGCFFALSHCTLIGTTAKSPRPPQTHLREHKSARHRTGVSSRAARILKIAEPLARYSRNRQSSSPYPYTAARKPLQNCHATFHPDTKKRTIINALRWRPPQTRSSLPQSSRSGSPPHRSLPLPSDTNSTKLKHISCYIFEASRNISHDSCGKSPRHKKISRKTVTFKRRNAASATLLHRSATRFVLFITNDFLSRT